MTNATTSAGPGDPLQPLARRPRRWRRAFLLLLFVLALAAAGWTAFSLSWSYSDGDRGGVLQKFSRKGWLCKTYEGELALYVVAGVAPQIWYFTVRDPRVAAKLSNLVGERVQVHYTEHRGVPTSCFGDTGYFVDEGNAAGAPRTPPQASSDGTQSGAAAATATAAAGAGADTGATAGSPATPVDPAAPRTLGLAGAAPAASDSAKASGSLTGRVSYRLRVALPADAEVIVRLDDVTRRDAASVHLSEQRFVSAGRQVPLPFELRFDPSTIDPARTYAASAEIWSAGELIFTTATRQPVLTAGAPSSDVDLRLEPLQRN
jgi:uncharacterized lipoprotein YbaY